MVESKTNSFGSFLESYQSASESKSPSVQQGWDERAKAEEAVLTTIAGAGTISVGELKRDTSLPVTQVLELIETFAGAELIKKTDQNNQLTLEITENARRLGLFK